MIGLALDHCAIAVRDVDRARAFYTDVLGAEAIALPRGVFALRCGQQIITVHHPKTAPQPHVDLVPGGAHIAFRWEGSVRAALDHLERHGVRVELGPVERRAVADGQGVSVYFRDPDGALLEFVCSGSEEHGPALFLDVGSPFAYLAVARLERLALPALRLVPVALGGLFRRGGRSSWALSRRRELGMREVESRARAYGLPEITWPDPWPTNYLTANRAAVAADEFGLTKAFIQEAGRIAFSEGQDLGQRSVLLEVARRVGLAPGFDELLDAAETKVQLRRNTDGAWSAGVRGVPTAFVGGALFWGDDQLEVAEAHHAATAGGGDG